MYKTLLLIIWLVVGTIPSIQLLKYYRSERPLTLMDYLSAIFIIPLGPCLIVVNGINMVVEMYIQKGRKNL